MIIALHGFGSSGDKSSTMIAIKQHFKDQTVLTPTYDVTQPFVLAAQLKDLAETHPEEELHIVGISFGGFLARWLAHNTDRIVSSLTLLNPVLDGAERLKERIGVNKSFVDAGDIVITTSIVDVFKGFKIKEDKPGLAINVLLGGKDEVIDPEPTVEFYKGRALVEVIGKADHRFSDHQEQMLKFVQEAVDTIAG